MHTNHRTYSITYKTQTHTHQYLLRLLAIDVEVRELDVNSLILSAIEQVVTLGIARVDAGVVGTGECAVTRLVTHEGERTR